MKILKRPLQLIRLFHINYILFKNRIDTVFFSVEPFQSWSFLSYFNPWNWFNPKPRTRGETIRLILEQLGPIFVKFGQILSTRRDLLPTDIADELAKLQDCVPPFPGALAKQIVERRFQQPLETIFSSFDLTPLASASIAQVHAATLHDGKKVVVKILRPNLEKVIRNDINLLYSVVSLTEWLLPQANKLKPSKIVAEFERSIFYELDLLHEGANASLLRRNFLHSSLLYVPEIYWEYSSSSILVMERIAGIPISDVASLRQHGINLKKLAEKGVEIFFTQVLRDSFFHADMHPGNIFVSKENPEDPVYIAVDFGIMGTLSPGDQRYIAENLLAFFRRDYRRVAELHFESGWVGEKFRIDEFETAIRGVSEPIFERPLKDISFGNLLLKLFQAATKFQIEIQPQFFLLQKTLVSIEGLGRQLYPELDLWATAKPQLEKWMQRNLGPKGLLRKLVTRGPYWLDKLAEVPDLVHHMLVAQQKLLLYPPKTSKVTKRSSRKLWLGFGLGLLLMALLNFFLGGAVMLNLLLGMFAVLIIVFATIHSVAQD